MIFNIQRFSTHDGKGIRTNIFFKGCPLRCKWCNNPESQNMQPEIFFTPSKCILCMECVKSSKNNEFYLENEKIALHRESVKTPEIFRDICPTKAIEVVGNKATVENIIEEVIKDLPFFNNSDGGVTVSGGEVFFQPELLEALTKALKKHNINISAETCLDVPWNNIKRSAQNIDVFLADLKHIDHSKFKEFTNGNLTQVLSNFIELEHLGANVIVRIPVINGFNASEHEMYSILDFAAGLSNVSEVNLLPYHSFGTGKYTLLGRIYDLHNGSVDDELINNCINYAKKIGLKANIGG
ncbi:MAG: glycyl-radical enzyme activating protein [Firmicutes bacterium HGW-Firmicutes-7]|nr:MAG: glycyl-radical enzyme activating protein [Firmicutes bacterium HGW-Firmicutes-7]